MKYVAYYRVSTEAQGDSGLGLAAQRKALAEFIRTDGGEILADYTDVTSAKGRRALKERPNLALALKHAKREKAELLVSSLDRLARNVYFVAKLLEDKTPIKIANMPTADPFTIHIMAAVAEKETRDISQRTKAALRAKKDRGETVGNVRSLRTANERRALAAREFALLVVPDILLLQARDFSQREIAEHLNREGVPTANGGKWTQTQVSRILNAK